MAAAAVTFPAAENDLDEDMWQDIDAVAVENFPGTRVSKPAF